MYRTNSRESSDNESRRTRSPACSTGSRSPGYRAGQRVGSPASVGSGSSAGSRRRTPPGSNYVSPYGQRNRPRNPPRSNYYSDSSDDERRRPGPAIRRGSGNKQSQKSPVNVQDIDQRLNKLQELLKFAKS
jgi:hypothetical protein